MRKFFGPMGSVSRISVESQALRSNMLGDPSVRVVDVYLPAGHDGQGLPLLVDLVGFTSSGLSHTNWVGFRENLPERLDRLIGEQRMPPEHRRALALLRHPATAAERRYARLLRSLRVARPRSNDVRFIIHRTPLVGNRPLARCPNQP